MARKYAIGQAIPDPISQGLDALRQGLIAARANKDSALERALREKQLEASNRQAEFEKQKFETENAPIDFDPLRSYYTPEEQSRYEQTYGVSDATGKKTIKIPKAVIAADIERKKVMAELAKTNKESDERVSISDLIAARNNPLGSNIKIKPSDLDQVVPKPATEKEGYAEIPAEEYFKSINQPVPPRFQGKTLKVKLPDYGQAPKEAPIDNRVKLGDVAAIRGVKIDPKYSEMMVEPSAIDQFLGKVKEEKEDDKITINEGLRLRGQPELSGEIGQRRVKPADLDNLFGKIESPKEKEELISVDEALGIRGLEPLGGKLGSKRIKASDLDNVIGPIRDPKDPKQQFTVPASVFYNGQVPEGMDPNAPIPIGNQTLKQPSGGDADLTQDERDYLNKKFGWAPTTKEGAKMQRAEIVAGLRQQGLTLDQFRLMLQKEEQAARREERKEDKVRRDTENLSKRVEKGGAVASIEPMRQLKATIGDFSNPNAKLDLSKLPGRGTTTLKALPFVGNVMAREAARSYGGENVLQSLTAVNNALLKVSAGTAVSAAEESRLMLERGLSAGGTSEDIIQGLRLADKAFALEDQAIRGGYNSEAKNLFEMQGGIPAYESATRPSQNLKSNTAAPKTSLVEQAKAELERRKNAKKKRGK